MHGLCGYTLRPGGVERKGRVVPGEMKLVREASVEGPEDWLKLGQLDGIKVVYFGT